MSYKADVPAASGLAAAIFSFEHVLRELDI
jgi:hypothetical protein